MNYKPDEAKLTSYLYGELSGEEHEKVSSYLEANPELKKELEGIQSLQKLMGKLSDKDVNEPSFVFEDSPTIVLAKNNSFNNFLKSTVAIAASISLLILVGYFTQVRVSSNDSGWQLSFGTEVQGVEVPNFNEESIKSWMKETLVANNESLVARINQMENNLDNQSAQLQATSSGVKRLANYKLDEDLIDRYVAQITRENRDIILNLMDVAGRSQKEYLDDMMTDFAKFMESQRQSDFDIIQEQLNVLVDNSEANPIDDYRNSE